MFNFFKEKTKNSSIPPKEENVNEEVCFQDLVPTINELDEVREMKELSPETEFLSNEDEAKLMEKIQEKIRREERRMLPIEEEGEEGYVAQLAPDFDDMQSIDSFEYRWGWHIGNWN